MTMYPVVILAGGLATRLRPRTVLTPKSMIDIGGEPFIAHQLRLLQKHGVKEVVMCVGYLADQLIDYVSKHFSHLNIQFSNDGDSLLGTGGAIKNALPLLPDHFFVTYGDSYLNCDYSAVQHAYIKSHLLGLMTVYRNKNDFDKSNVIFKNNCMIAYDKNGQHDEMEYIDYGLGIFNKKAFSYMNDHAFDLADLYKKLLGMSELAGFEVFERFYEIGSFSGIQSLNDLLAVVS